MARHSLFILRNVTKKRWENSSFKEKIDYDVYKKMMLRLSELLNDEIVNNEEGLFIPSLGIFKVIKNKLKNGYLLKDKNKKPYYNFHSSGYVFGIKFYPEKTLPNKFLYKFNANRPGLKKKLADRIFAGYTNYTVVGNGIRK